jgi:hypothetical protein
MYAHCTVVYCIILLEEYRLIVKRRFTSPSEPESYAGGRESV